MAGDPPIPSCAQAFDACVASGESRMSCARRQRECERGMR
jgi:hypothetical protein